MDGPEGVLGRQGVTRREAELLSALAERLSNAEIAAGRCLSERTVESHVSSLLHKLGVRSRRDLVRRSGLRAPPSAADAGRLPYQLDAIEQTGECVGRDEELRRLLECWERSATGNDGGGRPW
jgi:DNA-binding CsgD family transcriptional regulator